MNAINVIDSPRRTEGICGVSGEILPPSFLVMSKHFPLLHITPELTS